MSRRVSLSEKTARGIRDFLRETPAPVSLAKAYTELCLALLRDDLSRKRTPKASHKSREPSSDWKRRIADGMFGPPRHKSRKPTKAERRDARAAIREKVFARAEGRCEGPAGSNPLYGGRCLNPATDLQHVFGRGKGRMPESERNCLAACRTCHDAEGRNDPSGAAWWEWFWAFFTRNSWMREAAEAGKRAHFEATRSELGAGLKERHRKEAEEKIQELEARVHKAVFTEEG